jgi:hypothetical protein
MATNPFTPEGIPTYMLGTPNAQMPNPQDSATLPMFNPQNGFSDSGVGSTNVNIDSARAGNDIIPEDGKDAPGTPD